MPKLALTQRPSFTRAEWEARPAAVLVPFYWDNGEWHLLFTQRTQHVESHKGQVSFPGGRADPEDVTRIDTALREAEEEIGLKRAYVEVLGRLPDHAVITGYRVTPVVGLVRPGFELVLDPVEVAGSFEAPLRHLLDPSTHSRRKYRIAGVEVETFDLPWGSFNIWGATAGMLLTLREILGVRDSDGD